MSGKKSNPPELAIWLLRHACPGGDNEALTGDLIERFRQEKTCGWFWRQTFIAFIISVQGEIRRRWSLFCYAIAGTIAIWVLPDGPATRQLPGWLYWGDLPWPRSQFALELSCPALLLWQRYPFWRPGS